jgi:hypothetical protein
VALRRNFRKPRAEDHHHRQRHRLDVHPAGLRAPDRCHRHGPHHRVRRLRRAIDVVTTPRFAAVAGLPYMASIQVKTGGQQHLQDADQLVLRYHRQWIIPLRHGDDQLHRQRHRPLRDRAVHRPHRRGRGLPAHHRARRHHGDLDRGAGRADQHLRHSPTSTATPPARPGKARPATRRRCCSPRPTRGRSPTPASRVATASGPAAGDAVSFTETATIARPARRPGLRHLVRLGHDPVVRLRPPPWPQPHLRPRPAHRRDPRDRGVPQGEPLGLAQVRGGKVGLSGGAFIRTVDDYEFAAGRPTPTASGCCPPRRTSPRSPSPSRR